MKPSRTSIIIFLILVVLIVTPLMIGLRWCRNYPLRTYPGILETVNGADAPVWNDLQETYFRLHPLGEIGQSESQLHFVTEDSLTAVLDFLTDNGCTSEVQAEFTEYSAAVVRVDCENAGSALLTFVDNGHADGNLVSYDYFYTAALDDIVQCWKREVNARGE